MRMRDDIVVLCSRNRLAIRGGVSMAPEQREQFASVFSKVTPLSAVMQLEHR